jgi:ABC-type transport system involved in multi-copper enzyme maturation permease subunit
VNKLWAIAANTFREAVRNRILYALLFFALVMIVASSMLGHLTIGEYHKIIKDTGLAAIAVFGVLIAIFIGIGLVNREIERKTIFTIASKPVSRSVFVLGKYLGLMMVLVVLVGLMGAVFLLMLYARGIAVDAGLLIALGMTLVELAVITAFAVLFSTFSSPTIASFFSLSVFVIGHLSDDILELGAAAESGAGQKLATLVYWLLPHLETFNVRSEVVYGLALPADYLGFAVAYGALYSAVVLALAALTFHLREF